MMLLSEIGEIRKILINHEKRLTKLESDLKETPNSKSRRVHSGRKTIPDLLEELKREKFFSQPKFTSDIVNELKRKGNHYPSRSLTYALQQAVRTRVLGRIEKSGKWTYVQR